jgi:hypothetical protein
LWYVVCACFPYLTRPPVPWLIERVTMRWVGWREMHGCWVPTQAAKLGCVVVLAEERGAGRVLFSTVCLLWYVFCPSPLPPG